VDKPTSSRGAAVAMPCPKRQPQGEHVLLEIHVCNVYAVRRLGVQLPTLVVTDEVVHESAFDFAFEAEGFRPPKKHEDGTPVNSMRIWYADSLNSAGRRFARYFNCRSENELRPPLFFPAAWKTSKSSSSLNPRFSRIGRELR
jgi:hypothetical protein